MSTRKFEISICGDKNQKSKYALIRLEKIMILRSENCEGAGQFDLMQRVQSRKNINFSTFFFNYGNETVEWKAGDRFSLAKKKIYRILLIFIVLIISYKSVVNEDKLQKKDISTSFDVVTGLNGLIFE